MSSFGPKHNRPKMELKPKGTSSSKIDRFESNLLLNFFLQESNLLPVVSNIEFEWLKGNT